MTLTTFLNNNLAWVVIGGLIIIIVVIILKKNKKSKDWSNDFKDIPQRPLKPVYQDLPENVQEAREHQNPFNELDKEVKEYEQLQERLKKQVNLNEMKKWNPPEMFPKKQPMVKELPRQKPDKPKRKILPILAIIFVLAIVICSVVFWYGVSKDKFKSFSGQNCLSNLTCPNIPPCPAQQSCPSCICPQNNFSCPIVNTYCTNHS